MKSQASKIFTPTGAFRPWISSLIVIIGMMVMLGTLSGFVLYRQHQADQDWCELLTDISQPFPTATASVDPATLQRSRKVLHDIGKLRQRKGCVKPKPSTS